MSLFNLMTIKRTTALSTLLLALIFSHSLYAAQGYATRYWDACKPHFSWNENSNNNPIKTCNVNNEINPLGGSEIASSCNGGDAYTCWDMVPTVVSDTLSYGYAAIPGTGDASESGQCYAITFTGTGKYNDNEPGSVALKSAGKTMIVMATNIGHDVEGGQFDLLIPGGGVGLFDAFSTQLSVTSDDLGATYGGFLTACQADFGYNDTDKLKSCVQSQCDSIFSKPGMEDLKNGCDWYVDWFEMADNPNLEYEEVACPTDLISAAYNQTDDSSTDNSGTDDSNTDNSGTDDSNTDNSGSDDSNTDNSDSDDSNTDNSDSDDSNTDNSGSDDSSTDNSGSDNSSTDDSNTDNSGSDNSSTDDSNTDNSGSDNSSTDDSNTDDSNTDDSGSDDTNIDNSNSNDSGTDNSNTDNSEPASTENNSSASGGLLGWVELFALFAFFYIRKRKLL